MAFKRAGADKVLLKHETADEVLFARLHPDGTTFVRRTGLLKQLGELGFEAGGGFMAGLPGQSIASLAQDIITLKRLGCHMAGIGPFLPCPGTPFADAPPGSAQTCLNVIAAARLFIGKIHLPATTSLGVLAGDSGKSALESGANVLMRKVEPYSLRSLYQIYPGANAPPAGIKDERLKAEELIKSAGRIPV